MRYPPLIIGLITVYWGICSGFFVVSIAAAVVFEAVWIVKTRFDLKDIDFIKISDLSSVIMLILLFYSYLENEPNRIFLYFLSTMPIVFMPLMFAQLYSTKDKVVIGTSFAKGVHRHAPLDIRGPYFISAFIGAASSNFRVEWFFPVTLLLSLWVLSNGKFTVYRFIKYAVSAICVSALSLFLIFTIESAHMRLRDKLTEMYRNWYMSLREDPYRTSTAMGETGYLKLSGRIVMRVVPHSVVGIPLYLKTADYNVFSASSWGASNKRTTPIFPYDDRAWQLFGESKSGLSMTVSKWMGRDGQGLLALPEGSDRAEEMDVAGVEKTALGVIMIDEGPDLLDYTIFFNEKVRHEPSPVPEDKYIPENEIDVITRVVRDNDLKGLNDVDSVMRISGYFSSFGYSLELESSVRNGSVLEDFLYNTRSGHCEYFATATVLMLRKVGIPARYSVGYSVSEYSNMEKSFIVRERDAHAWVTAFVNGEWITIDTTPPIWYEADRDRRSFLEPVNDFFSWLRIEYERFRRTKNEEFNRLLIIIATILTIFMMIKIYIRKRKVSDSNIIKNRIFDIQGKDSPFYTILSKYKSMGFGNFENESVRMWKKRVFSNNLSEKEKSYLDSMIIKHENLRFNPGVEKETLAEELKKLCKNWIGSMFEPKKKKKR